MVSCGVALALKVGFLRREWSAQREEGSLGNRKSSGVSGAVGETEIVPEPWLWALTLAVLHISGCRGSAVASS